ncbi:MAG: calcium-binding protein, partial [Selenomonadaceae bacterium]|nr:calcium-binding protein [Selenomonadaceae bacterium]
MSNQQEVIKKFMASFDNTTLNGTEALDEAIKVCSNFNSIQEVINKMISDCENAGSADDFLKNYCGIDLNNTDTGSITGKDAGGSKVKIAESVIPENGNLDTSFYERSFTINGLTVKLDDSYSTLTTDQLFIWQALYTWWTKGALDLISESYGKNFGFDNNSSASVKEITISFSEVLNSGTRAGTVYNFQNSSATSLRIDINMAHFDSISNGSFNGDDEGLFYLDRTIAHELTHCTMYANINYAYEIPLVILEGLAELTHGVDDGRKEEIERLANDSKLLRQSLVFSTSEKNYDNYAGGYMLLRYLAKQASLNISNYTNNTIISGSSDAETIYNEGGNVKINSGDGNDNISNNENGHHVTINAGNGNDTINTWAYTNGSGISSAASYSVIDGGAGNDQIFNQGSANVTLIGGNGNDYIYNSGNDTKIYGGSGNDTLINGYGFFNGSTVSSGNHSTIDGGTGNDIISLASGVKNNLITYKKGDGKDTIYGIALSDTIEISDEVYEKSISGSDVILKVSTGSIIVKDAKNINFTIKSGEGDITLKPSAQNIVNTKSNTIISGSNFNDTILNNLSGSKVKINVGGGNDTITNFAQYVTINGDNGNDYIANAGSRSKIYGGAGNDTFINGYNVTNNSVIASGNYSQLDSGDGNDSIINWVTDNVTITGGKGNDTIFLGNDNNKSLIKYSNGDGNDIIQGYSSSSTISISGGYSTQNSGSDVVIKVGSGKMTLKNAKGTKLNI